MFHHLDWTTPPKLALGKEVWPKGGKKKGRGGMPSPIQLPRVIERGVGVIT